MSLIAYPCLDLGIESNLHLVDVDAQRALDGAADLLKSGPWKLFRALGGQILPQRLVAGLSHQDRDPDAVLGPVAGLGAQGQRRDVRSAVAVFPKRMGVGVLESVQMPAEGLESTAVLRRERRIFEPADPGRVGEMIMSARVSGREEKPRRDIAEKGIRLRGGVVVGVFVEGRDGPASSRLKPACRAR